MKNGKLRNSLKVSFIEGGFSSAMSGLTDNFWVACAEAAIGAEGANGVPCQQPPVGKAEQAGMPEQVGDGVAGAVPQPTLRSVA